MLKHRVIPILLIDDGGLVKTHKFSKPKYVGDPINAIRIFNEKEVDELVVLDISASRKNRGPDFDLISDLASECFMPLAYGGGISTIEEVRKLFSLGVEKVCLQTAALNNLNLVTQVAEKFGVQSVVVSVDITKNWLKQNFLYESRTGKKLKMSGIDFIKQAVKSGAGEILLNSVDRDGTMSGYDLELISEVAHQIEVPLIASGGAGSLAHFREAVDAGASACAAGAFFVFQGPHRAVLISYPKYKELVNLFS